MSLDNLSWNPPKQHVVMKVLFDDFLKGFLTPRLNFFQQFSSCGPCRVFSHSNSPSHRALGQYWHTSSSRQFRNISCWLEILNYCPDCGNGNFHCSSSFLKATSLICQAQLSFAAYKKYILWFFSLWWMIKGMWALFSLLVQLQVNFICIAHLQQPPGWPKCFTEEPDYATYTENKSKKCQ